MFSKELSFSVLSICDSRDLSYEAASELCGLSSRHFASIARGQTVPSVNTLGKFCVGFEKTPNELLGFPTTDEELSYRATLQVRYYRQQPSFNCPSSTFPVCPRCHSTIEREYQSFCDRCGQKLGWDYFHYATLMSKL